MKTTKISKNRINTTKEQHAELLQIAKVLRNATKQYLHPSRYGLNSYLRVFTEPRKDGVRTKFWIASTSQGKRMRDTCNEILKKKYKGRFEASIHQSFGDNWFSGHQAVSIHIRRVK